MILFITRKYPPTIGGMEKVAYELSQHLANITEVKLVKWGGSKHRWIPFVLPYLLFRSSWVLLTKDVNAIYLQDGLLSPLGIILKTFRVPIFITIHGNDITYNNKIYQFLIPRFVAKMDGIICVSQATRQQCIIRGISSEKIKVIPNGIPYTNDTREIKLESKEILSNKLGLELLDKKIILSVGHLVERKGIHWFVDKVMPLIVSKHTDVVYLIVGNGRCAQIIEQLIKQNGLDAFVFMLGKVETDTLNYLFQACDIFIMPNIPINNDVEGFGVAILEAASNGLPVVASNIEGIKDAIKDGKNGYLIEPRNALEFCHKIEYLLNNDKIRIEIGNQSRKYTIENFSWEIIAKRYLDCFSI